MPVAQFDGSYIIATYKKKHQFLWTQCAFCAAKWSGWIWQSPFWILAFACTVALNCQNTSQDAFHACGKRKKSNPIPIIFWRMKISDSTTTSNLKWKNSSVCLFKHVIYHSLKCWKSLKMHLESAWIWKRCKNPAYVNVCIFSGSVGAMCVMQILFTTREFVNLSWKK